MLPPPAQLEVDKFPHHEGLSEADGSQDSYPNRVETVYRKVNTVIS